MILSIERLGLIAALLAGSAAASSQDERDLYLRAVPIQRPHVPDLLDRPPCVDGALLGALRRDTHELIIDPHSPYRGSTRYWFEFRPARVLFGPAPPERVRFAVLGDARLALGDNIVLLVRREANGQLAFVNAEYVIADRRARPFIPLVWAPLRPLPGSSWLPLGYAAFAREVRYWDSEMRRRGHSAAFLAQVADAGDFNRNWVQWRDGRAVVARGVYLDALPAMFARQTPASCRRRAPDLANRDPSR